MLSEHRLVELFLQLARIEGLSGCEQEVNQFIRRFLAEIGFRAVEDGAGERHQGNSGNLITKIGSGGDFVVLAHMDTARSTRDLKPVVTGDRITSDGTTILGADNRAGIAAILYNLERAIQDHLALSDFTVVFTIREETDVHGSLFLELPATVRRGFVFDSALRPGRFIYRTYGAQAFQATVRGKASHSGIAPEKGISAIQTAARAIDRLRLGRIDSETTANIGRMNAGTAVNVIPETAIMEGEVRSLQTSKIEATIATIRDSFMQAGTEFGAQIDFSSHWGFRPFHLAADSPTYQTISRVIRQAGLEPVPSISAGGSDANSLNLKGIESVNLGIGAQNPHSNDEFILIEDLHQTAAIVWNLIKKE